MPQVLLRPEQITGDVFRLDGKEAHHVLRVLRKKVGDELALFDGRGSQFRGVLTDINAAMPELRGRLILQDPFQKQPTSNKTTVRLFQGIPKGSKMEFVIEKAVELGVDEILPFLSEKSLIKLDAKQAASKQARWRRLAEAAAKQCGRPSIPEMAMPRKLMELETEFKSGLTLVFAQQSESKSLRILISKTESVVNLIIGPESGFSRAELIWLKTHGAKPASLGNLTLRTETAGLAALTLVKYELGLL